MNPDLVMNVELIASYIGWVLRALGMLVFGLMSAWLIMSAYLKAGKAWQVPAVAIGGLLYLAGELVFSSNAVAVGAYTLGVGVGLFIFGFNANKGED